MNDDAGSQFDRMPDQIIIPTTTISLAHPKDVIGSEPVACLSPECDATATLFFLSPTDTWPNRAIACKTCRHVGWSLGQIPTGLGMNRIDTSKD